MRLEDEYTKPKPTIVLITFIDPEGQRFYGPSNWWLVKLLAGVIGSWNPYFLKVSLVIRASRYGIGNLFNNSHERIFRNSSINRGLLNTRDYFFIRGCFKLGSFRPMVTK